MKVTVDDNTVVHAYVDWAEMVKKYTGVFTGGEGMKSRKGKEWALTLKHNHEGSFYGASAEQMIERIAKGYSFPKVELINMPVVSYDRPRPRFTDDPEGEFDNDMFISGETEYFLSKPKRRSVGGIRMKVQIGFTGMVNDRTINEYFTWVGQTIQAIQARGYDLELSVFNHNEKLYHPSGYKDSFQNIRISKFGERIIPHDWSALFSPGGHRHFMFMFYMWAGEQENMAYANDLGASMGKGWRLEWNKDQRALTVHVDSRSNQFPAGKMTKELEDWKD
jgi:hypothetical protein